MPQPLNLPHRPKTVGPGPESSSDTKEKGGNTVAAPPVLKLSTSVAQDKTLPATPPIPPRNPARRRKSLTKLPGHRPAQKVHQLIGYDVDVYEDYRKHYSYLDATELPAELPANLFHDHSSNEEQEAVAADAPASPSPIMTILPHGYPPFYPLTPDEEPKGEDKGSIAGSRQTSAQFSASSRPSWASSSRNLSYDDKASSRSRDSFSDADAALDYHRFASELAGPTDRKSSDSNALHYFTIDHSKRPASSHHPHNDRSSDPISHFRDLSFSRSPLQQIEALAASHQLTLSLPGKKRATAHSPKSPQTAEDKHKDPTTAATLSPQTPHLISAFESDSDDEGGFTDSMKHFFARRASHTHDVAANKSPKTSKDDSDKSLLTSAKERAKEWRSDRRKEPKQAEDIPKYYYG